MCVAFAWERESRARVLPYRILSCRGRAGPFSRGRGRGGLVLEGLLLANVESAVEAREVLLARDHVTRGAALQAEAEEEEATQHTSTTTLQFTYEGRALSYKQRQRRKTQHTSTTTLQFTYEGRALPYKAEEEEATHINDNVTIRI